MKLHEFIDGRRKQLGLTLNDIAKMVGVSTGTVAKWESGFIANMRRDRIKALSKTLQCSPLVLMSSNIDDSILNGAPKFIDASTSEGKETGFNKGAFLRDLRHQSGLTLEEVGEKIGVSKQTLYKYESNIVANIPSEKVELLARLYKVSPVSIMGWSSEKPKEKQLKLQDKLEQFIDLLATSTGISFFNENASEDKGKSFGERVKKARQDAGLSQHELAMLAGYTSRSSIGKIESGKRDIARNKIAAIAKITGVTTSYLIGGESFLEIDTKTRKAILVSLKSTLALSQCLSENEEKKHD